MTRAVLTSCYGDYDAVKPAPADLHPSVEFIYVTDDPAAAANMGWDVRFEPRPGVHPNRAAKRPKMLPWQYTDADEVLWIDASFALRDEFVGLFDFADPIAQFTHPHRDCIYDEAEHTLQGTGTKYETERIEGQLCRYENDGHPAHWGLWATGVIVRQRCEPVEQYGYVWYADNLQYTFQDQLSEAPALRWAGLRPSPIPYVFWENPWLNHHPSARH